MKPQRPDTITTSCPLKGPDTRMPNYGPSQSLTDGHHGSVLLCFVFCLHVHMCTMSMANAHRGQKKALALLELELQMGVRN